MNPDAVNRLRAWRADPRLFVREALGATPDAWQDEVLEASMRHQRIALKASKGPGKSTLLAWLGWWFLMTRLHPKVLATSITGDNLRDGLWTEMAKWQQKSRLLSYAFTWSAERIIANDHPKTWWASARTWPKGADSSQQANTLAGVHADNVLFLVDEAGGIPDAVVATAEAGLANADPVRGTEAMLVIAGNPTQTSGPLYRACTRERALWFVKEISGAPDDPGRAPRVSAQWAREQIEKYGRDSAWVLVNVFGQFPPSQSNALIGVEDAAAAARRTLGGAEYLDEPKVLGVDVARFGDDRTVIFPRQGKAAMRPTVLRNLDTMQVASQVAMVVDKWTPDAVFVDVATFGAGVVDRLHQLGYPVLGIDSAAKPNNPRYHNRRAEMWFGLSEWMKAGCIPDDPELIAELTAPTYLFDAQGRLQVEKKAEVKARITKSPDLADALAFTFAAPVAHKSMQGLLARQPQAKHEWEPYQEES